MIGLTPRQQKCLIFIQAYMRDNGIAPSYSEIGAALGAKSKSHALYVVDALEAAGFVKRMSKRARSIELLPTEDHHATDCECLGCARVRYLASLKLVQSLQVPAPISLIGKWRGLRPLTDTDRAHWRLGAFPDKAAPRTRTAVSPRSGR